MNSNDSRSHSGSKRFFESLEILRSFFYRWKSNSKIDVEEEIENKLYQINRILSTIPKGLVREYLNSKGYRVRKTVPVTYGYLKTRGVDGKPLIREFGNLRHSKDGHGLISKLERENKALSPSEEPILDLLVSDSEFKVILELPYIIKENSKINISEYSMEVIYDDDSKRKYQMIIELPVEVVKESTTSKYNNGILEISFNKSEQIKSNENEITVNRK